MICTTIITSGPPAMELSQLSIRLHDIMTRQVQQLALLREYLIGAQLIQAKVFALPPHDPDAETRNEVFIPTQHFSGHEALMAAIDAWGRLSAFPGENTRLVFRLPGAIQVHSDDNDLLAGIVLQINADREEFKSLVTSAPALSHPEDRHEFLHSRSMFPGLMTLQLYRQIPLPSLEVRSVSFCWAHKNSQKNVTRDSLLRSIAHAQQCPPKSMIDPSDWIEQLEKEKELLASLPADAQLQIRRPLPVQPQAWLTTAAGPKMVVASTPLLILSPNKIAMGELSDYDANNRRAPRRPKSTADEPLIPRLWLYQKETTL